MTSRDWRRGSGHPLPIRIRTSLSAITWPSPTYLADLGHFYIRTWFQIITLWSPPLRLGWRTVPFDLQPYLDFSVPHYIIQPKSNCIFVNTTLVNQVTLVEPFSEMNSKLDQLVMCYAKMPSLHTLQSWIPPISHFKTMKAWITKVWVWLWTPTLSLRRTSHWHKFTEQIDKSSMTYPSICLRPGLILGNSI